MKYPLRRRKGDPLMKADRNNQFTGQPFRAGTGPSGYPTDSRMQYQTGAWQAQQPVQPQYPAPGFSAQNGYAVPGSAGRVNNPVQGNIYQGGAYSQNNASVQPGPAAGDNYWQGNAFAQGAAAAGQNYMQNGAFAQGTAAAQQGYPPMYMPPQQFAGQGTQNGTPYAYPQQQPYPYAQPASYPQQPRQADFIPQTPYTQGYSAQGYPQQNAAYPYAQYRQPEQNTANLQNGDPNRQIPINGGGYVPPRRPVNRAPFQFNDTMLFLTGGVLLLLFVLGMFVPALKAFRWVFLAAAAASVALFWIRPLIAENKRLCFTIVFGALAAVTLIGMIGSGGVNRAAGRTEPPQQTQTTPAVQSNGGMYGGGAMVVDPRSGQIVSVATEPPAAQATPSGVDTTASDRLDHFFSFWNNNNLDEMLPLCSPTWQGNADNPKAALFGLLMNRTPESWEIEKISGTEDDTSRTVTVTALIDRNNGKTASKYRLSVLMVKENGQWYLDPQSLKTNEAVDPTVDPATVTATPTAEPVVSGDTVLYFNPDGGSKYHLDPNCKSTHQKFLPLKGKFKYKDVNKDEYKKLSPCNVCAAPLR